MQLLTFKLRTWMEWKDKQKKHGMWPTKKTSVAADLKTFTENVYQVQK